MKNIFKSSEFALAMAALAQAPLAGQPNAKDSAAYAGAEGLQTLGQGLAQQEALKKARKEAEKQKKGALGGSLGSLIGGAAMSLIPGVGPFAAALLAGGGATVGGSIGTAVAGGSGGIGDAALKYGAPAAVGGLVSAGANKLGDLVLKGTTAQVPLNTGHINSAYSPDFKPFQATPGPAGVMLTGRNKEVVTKPLRNKLGNAIKRVGSNINRLPAESNGTFTFHPDGGY
jgi:hypothetical protein